MPRIAEQRLCELREIMLRSEMTPRERELFEALIFERSVSDYLAEIAADFDDEYQHFLDAIRWPPPGGLGADVVMRPVMDKVEWLADAEKVVDSGTERGQDAPPGMESGT